MYLIDDGMSGFRLFKDKVLDKFDKLTAKWNKFTKKVTKINRNMGERFSEFNDKFDEMVTNLQTTDKAAAEILNGLETKKMIKGDVSYQNIEDFTRTLWESHDVAQEAFQETKDAQYHEMAMETLLVIREMEQLKEYLGKHGRI